MYAQHNSRVLSATALFFHFLNVKASEELQYKILTKSVQQISSSETANSSLDLK